MQNLGFQSTRHQLLFHPVFLFSLLLLITNDHWFKAAYPGWVTGKLSDFAGIIVLAVLLAYLFPRLSLHAALLSGAIFLLWKLPFSEPVIRFAHDRLHLPVVRLADYSDLLALLILPLARWLLRRADHSLLSYNWPVWSRNLLVLTATFACLATSAPASYKARHDGEITLDRRYQLKMNEAQALAKIKALIYDVKPDSNWQDVNAHPFFLYDLPLNGADTLKYMRFTLKQKKEYCELRLIKLRFNHPLTQGSVKELKKHYRRMLEAGLISRVSRP